MKLYVSPGTCSVLPQIVLREADIGYEAETVNLATKHTSRGVNYLSVNSKGTVPALELDTGELLTENAAIIQYLGDRKPEMGLCPPAGTFERYRLMEWLNYIAYSLHKGFVPLRIFQDIEPARQRSVKLLSDHLTYTNDLMTGRAYLIGDRFSVADAYLYMVLGWSGQAGIDLSRWPELERYAAQLGGRPKLRAAMEDDLASVIEAAFRLTIEMPLLCDARDWTGLAARYGWLKRLMSTLAGAVARSYRGHALEALAQRIEMLEDEVVARTDTASHAEILPVHEQVMDLLVQARLKVDRVRPDCP